MLTAQRILSDYRRRRWSLCLTLATLVFVLTLGIKFMALRESNEQHVLQFGQRAISTVERLTSPFDQLYEYALPLTGRPCDQIQQELRVQTAKVHTVRSVSLVEDGVVYCSSVFGASHFSLHGMKSRLPSPTPLLFLSIDQLINKGSVILVYWRPLQGHTSSGVIQVISMDILTGFIEAPEEPWINRVILNIANSHYEYFHGVLKRIDIKPGKVRTDIASKKYPFSITLIGPSASSLALQSLPAHLPLALIFSLLVGVITWLITAKRMSFYHEIKMGLAAREFEVYCQPLINGHTRQCIGIELLLRWNNPRHGQISPDVFIPLAEQQQTIIPLTRYVIEEAVTVLDRLPRSPEFHISINVAAAHFKNNVILDDLDRYWFPARPVQCLILELTERDALPEMDQQAVEKLHRSGVKLAIDDFGTGQSSLAYLEKLNPDVLKIDKTFTAAIGSDAVNSRVVDIIIALGHRLNIKLVAEGVETPEQAAYLCEQQVYLLQGYLYARPMPLEAFPAWLREHQLAPAEKS